VVQATRGYQRATRSEPGNVRCELWQTTGDPHAFTLFEVFREPHARTAHALSPHARNWQEAIAPLLSGTIQEEQAEALVFEAVPPPLPAHHRPALESSLPFGGALHVVDVAAGRTAARLPQLTVDLEAIEVAAARDRLPLRAAQPCVVFGTFVLDAAGAHGVARTVYRFAPPKSLPASLVGAQRLIDVPVPRGNLPLKLGVVVVSLEENGGTDVQAIYQALADANELSFWARGESCPTPSSLAECSDMPVFCNAARRVEVLRAERDLSDSVKDDTWAGAALCCFDLTAAVPERLARFHTAAANWKNDWLMTLRCRISSP